MNNKFTLIYPYYENPVFLGHQIRGWWKWPKGLGDFIKLIVVDDGSPENPASDVFDQHPELPFETKLFRIGVDVRWNWLAARNIGAHHAEDGWLLLTDMDHIVMPNVACALIKGSYDPRVIHRFSRKEHTGETIHPHPNSWFMTRKMYWKVGGYDETLSGYYGTDGDYRRRCAATATVEILELQLERHEHVGDSSTRNYLRKQPEDARGKQMMKQRPPKWRPKTLSFPYEEIQI